MKKYLIYCMLAVVAFGCSNEKRSGNLSSDATEANLEGTDTTLSEKIIKTADMRFRVHSVQNAKEQLSKAIKAEGGNVAEFSVQSDIQRTEKVQYSADSLLELTAYRTAGTIVARIPSDKLDGFTDKVAHMAVFVDFQSMKLDDQSLTYLSNKLKNQNRVEAVAQLNKHANKKSNNVESSLYVKDDYIDKKIENLRIDDLVEYSNITLNFYQDNTVKKIIVGNDDLNDYRPGFLRRFVLNLQNGWVIFKEFILVLTNLWMLILFLIAGVFIYKSYKRKIVKV